MASSARDGAGIAVSKFYGESLPRPTLMGDVQAPASDIAEKQDARRGFVPATQPLMEWSRKAPLRRGGTVPQWIGKPPKWIITPYRAFVMEQVRSLLRVDPDAKLLPFKEQVTLALKKSGAQWKSLDPDATAFCENLAETDAERYDRELEEYERRNPGYCAWAAARSKGRKARAALWPGAPAPAPTARQLFVRSRVAQAEHDDPELADAEPDARRAALRKVNLAALKEWKKLDKDTQATYATTADEASAKHEAEVEAYEAEHPGYRTWLAEAATAQAAAVKALRGRKRKSKSTGAKAGAKARNVPKTTDAEEPGDDGRDSAEDSDEDDDDFLGSDWEMELSGSDADEDGPAGDYEGDDGIDAAELEDLRRDAAGGSPRPADSSRRKRVTAPMSPSQASKGVGGGRQIVHENASAVADQETAAPAAQPPAKKSKLKDKKAGRKSAAEAAVRPSGDAPEDPEAVIGLTVSKLFFAPGSKRGEKKRKQQRFSGVVTEHNVLDGVDCWQIRYEDGDCEDVEWSELHKLLADADAETKIVGGVGGSGGPQKGGGRKSKNPATAAL